MASILNKIENLVADATEACTSTAATGAVVPATPQQSADAAPVQAAAPPAVSNVVRLPGTPPSLAPWVDTSGELHAFMVVDLAKSGLAPADVSGWYAVNGEGIGRYSRMSVGVPSGYAIPYTDLAGKPVQDNGQPFVRFKLVAPLTQDIRADGSLKDGAKYLSAKDSTSHVYIPRATAKLLAGAPDDLPLVITEGEKKAERLALAGIPCVALAGIYMWLDPEADKRESISVRDLHPELLAVIAAYTEWVDGKPSVLVMFDSDGLPAKRGGEGYVEVKDSRGKVAFARNGDVYRAAGLLANRLYTQYGMAVATTAAWCPEGAQGAKQGLDDWIVNKGAGEVVRVVKTLGVNPQHKILAVGEAAPLVLSGNLDADISALAEGLANHPDLYVFGDAPAIIKDGASSVRVLDHEGVLAREISKVVQTFRASEGGKMTACYLDKRLSETLLRSDWKDAGLRVVDAVSAQPVPMIVDRKPYVTRAGYDSTSRVYGAYDEAWDVPCDFNATGTDDFAEYVDAVQTLGELLDETYFETPADVAAMLAALITAVARPGLETAPAFLLSAPDSGAGKGYLAQVIGAIAAPGTDAADVMTLVTGTPAAEAEFGKMVLGALSSKRPVLQFDEVLGGAIDGKNLRTLLTSPTFSGRLLGTNKTVSLPTRKLVLVTASNVEPSQDSVRRVITVRITPPADPAQREQSADRGALDLLREDRARYAQAAVLVALGGMHLLSASESGMPVGYAPLPGYRDWSRLSAGPAMLAAQVLARRGKMPRNLIDSSAVGSIAARNPLRDHIEEINPMLRQKQTRDEDPARLALKDLLEAMYRFQTEKCDGQPWTSAQLVAELREQRHLAEKYQRDYGTDLQPAQFALYTELSSAGMRDDQMVSTTKLGSNLKQYRDRQVGGLRMVATRDRNKTSLWQVLKA